MATHHVCHVQWLHGTSGGAAQLYHSQAIQRLMVAALLQSYYQTGQARAKLLQR
jgi:hypothetical protein